MLSLGWNRILRIFFLHLEKYINLISSYLSLYFGHFVPMGKQIFCVECSNTWNHLWPIVPNIINLDDSFDGTKFIKSFRVQYIDGQFNRGSNLRTFRLFISQFYEDSLMFTRFPLRIGNNFRWSYFKPELTSLLVFHLRVLFLDGDNIL